MKMLLTAFTSAFAGWYAAHYLEAVQTTEESEVENYHEYALFTSIRNGGHVLRSISSVSKARWYKVMGR